ncbi:MAG: lipoyl(octanoyl) transferase LipB [Deltaproteobacteria bacterium]
MPRAKVRAAMQMQNWGRIDYDKALERQLELVGRRQRDETSDTIAFCEHPPTITLGRNAPDSDLLLGREEIDRRGIAVVQSDRGGRATYHGPGQAVVYPVVAIGQRGIKTRRWVALLEEAIVETLAGLGVQATAALNGPGVWARGGKIASLGLRIDRGVSYHGLCVNVGLDVEPFDCIVTCGVASQPVTTVEMESGRTWSSEAVAGLISEAIDRRLQQS